MKEAEERDIGKAAVAFNGLMEFMDMLNDESEVTPASMKLLAKKIKTVQDSNYSSGCCDEEDLAITEFLSSAFKLVRTVMKTPRLFCSYCTGPRYGACSECHVTKEEA